MTTTYRAVCSLILLTAVLPVTMSAQEAQEVDIRDFVRTTYIEGVPYDFANAYTPDVVPTLLAMLQDNNEEPYWGNIAVTLSVIGDERAVEPLLDFIEGDTEGEVTESMYRAKSSAIMALGYLVNKNGDGRSLDYLVESVEPEAWDQREIQWRAPFQADTEERNVDLSTVAILGLALSGRDEARLALLNTRSSEALMSTETGLIDTALEILDAVAALGLSEYYRESRARSER